MTPMQRMSGMDLRVMRVRADVKAIDLAREMKSSSSNVTRIETSRTVTEKAATAYIEALTRLTKPARGQEAA